MKRIDPAARKRFVRALKPQLLERQMFGAEFSDYRAARMEAGKVVMNPPFAGFDDITRQFLALVRPAVQTIRAFRRNPPSPRHRKYSRLLTSRGRALCADHSKAELFDATYVFEAMRDTGLRFVYSFTSRQVDLAALFSSLWNPYVLTNPATGIGPATVRYAKAIPTPSSTLRFVMSRDSYSPSVFVYAPKDRIVELFGFATEHMQFDKFRVRDVMQNY
jgi:hypothetical protein